MNVSFFQQQEQRINKQFISIFDSVYFISEHGEGTLQEALELMTGTFLRKQTYLLLITAHSVKAVYVCSSSEHSQYEPFITFESIIYELKECIDHRNIGTGNPIYKLGFAKKRFVEQLVSLGMQLDEQIIFNTESPDITHAEHENEGDEWAFYQGLPREYDTLRAENEKVKAQYQELFNKKGQPEAFYNIQKELYKADRQKLNECANKLDKSLLEVKSLNSHCTYLERSLEQSKRKEELNQQIAEKRILELESQLAQARAKPLEKPADDLKDVPHQSYRTVARVMYAMAQLAKVDNSKPFSQNKPSLNASITTILQNDGVPLESEAVGNWLSRINDIKPLK